MTSVWSSLGLAAGLLAAGPLVLQGSHDLSRGPLTPGPVAEAPFSAVATTIVRRSLPNGMRIDRTATARYFRDRAGRVRVEQTLLESDEAPHAAERLLVHIAPDPDSPRSYVVGSRTRTIWMSSREFSGGAIVGGSAGFVLAFRGGRFLEFSSPRFLSRRYPTGLSDGMQEIISIPESAIVRQDLGERAIGGATARGDRVTMSGSDRTGRAFEVVDERWESQELKLLLESRLVDSRFGTIDYRLSEIQRTEPAPDLFVVPADYATSGLFESGKMGFADAYNVMPNAAGIWLTGRN